MKTSLAHVKLAYIKNGFYQNKLIWYLHIVHLWDCKTTPKNAQYTWQKNRCKHHACAGLTVVRKMNVLKIQTHSR